MHNKTSSLTLKIKVKVTQYSIEFLQKRAQVFPLHKFCFIYKFADQEDMERGTN